MNHHVLGYNICLLALFLLVFSSCGVTTTKESQAPVFVINELLASNQTGWLNGEGDLYDWIEIRNISADSASLEGYTLSPDTSLSWTFPAVSLAPGEHLLVYASKQEGIAPASELHTCFKLPRENGHLTLSTPGGVVCSEVSYTSLSSDCSLQRLNDTTYVVSTTPSPGQPNTEEGYDKALALMDKQRSSSPLLIWEVLSKPRYSLRQYGRPVGWIKLKNVSDSVIHLEDYFLTNNPDKPGKWQLPEKTLAPGKTVIISATGNKSPKPGSLQCSFKLTNNEAVILTRGGRFLDGVNAATTPYGTSIGRVTDRPGFYYFATPSTKDENPSLACRRIAPAPEFSSAPGAYESSALTLRLNTHGVKVYYTLDGTNPSSYSTLYQDSICLTHTTVVRAIAYDSACIPSPVSTGTFLLSEGHKLPVACLTLNPSDLYSTENGIYAFGYNYRDTFPYPGANFWQPWEKPAHVEFFDGAEGFTTDCGVKMFGGYSRARSKKSMQVKFRSCFGTSSLHYPLYGEGKPADFKSFVLRSGSQDDKGTMVRDEFFTSLMDATCPTLHVQHYRPIVLYINAEYFGVYFIREKANDEFVANHLGVSPESATLLFASGRPEVGSPDEYNALVNYVRSHDMRDSACYQYVTERMDLLSYVDHKIGEIYSGNCDVGNVRFFCSPEDTTGGKWHWLFYDLDWGFYYDTPVGFYTRENYPRAAGKTSAPYNVLADRLLRNPEFRRLFIERFAWHCKNTLSVQNANAVFNQLIDSIQPEMERNCRRWPEMSYHHWQTNVDAFRARIAKRPDQIKASLREELNLTDEEWQLFTE